MMLLSGTSAVTLATYVHTNDADAATNCAAATGLIDTADSGTCAVNANGDKNYQLTETGLGDANTATLNVDANFTGAVSVGAVVDLSNNTLDVNFSGTTSSTGNINLGTTGTTRIDITGGTTSLGGGTWTADTVTVDNTATLSVTSATAAISAVTTVSNGGTLTAGASFTNTGALTVGAGASGTLNLGSNTVTVGGANAFTMNAGATLGTTISSSTAAGQVVATGAAPTVNAATTLSITVTATDYIASGTQFTIIDVGAAGINAPNTVTDDSNVLSFAASVSNNDLIITATRTTTYSSSVQSGSSASGAATTLTSISNSGATGDMATVLSALDNLSGPSQSKAIQSTTPEVSGGGVTSSFTAQGQTFGTVSARLGDVRAGLDNENMTGFATGNEAKGIGMWLRGFGSHTDQQKRQGVDGYRANTWGIATGADKQFFGDRLIVGLAYSYAGSDINSTGDRDGSGTDVKSHQGTLYGSYDSDLWYVEGMANGAFNQYDSARAVSVGTINRTATGDYDGWQAGLKVAGGYKVSTGNILFTPILSLQYSHLALDGYTETGANSLNLTVDDQNFDLLRSGLGAKVAYSIRTGVGTVIPELRAAWLYDIVTDNQEVTSTYSGGGGSFTTDGADPARHGASIGASISLQSSSNITLSADYDAEIKDRYVSHNGMLTARYDF